MVDTAGEKSTSMSFVAKAALILSHSNVSPERGFSVNNCSVDKGEGIIARVSLRPNCGP